MSQSTDREPVPDQAEFNAFFPSRYSLTQYVPPETDFDGASYTVMREGSKVFLTLEPKLEVQRRFAAKLRKTQARSRCPRYPKKLLEAEFMLVDKRCWLSSLAEYDVDADALCFVQSSPTEQSEVIRAGGKLEKEGVRSLRS
ncbi:uncharacterized protein UTRI_02590 [Ustilago trichophora]|uniref:Uncharacterized protein n=1 Tax=Ustilago trichophora TaxID=86804 RepID=A0A5C3EN30_9BASI|nr:uncharacterized protein UTRI_02590 [Ustilago trichophora]